MTLRVRPWAGPVIIALVLSLGLGTLATLRAQESPQEGENVLKSPAAATPALPQRLYGVGKSDSDATLAKKEEGTTLFGFASRVVIVLLIFTGGAYAIIHYARKGKLNLNALKPYAAESRLIIAESRMLGNRQYLMVVEYDDQKMLLAVTPGRVDHLCFLDTPFERESGGVPEEEDLGFNHQA